MCDPITAATVGLTGGAMYLDKQRRDANQAAREQSAATAAALAQVKPSVPSLTMPPMTEPLKAASDSAAGASQDTQRRQALARGLMSTFTRYAPAQTPTLAGKATTLGGR